jgi:hypothetical protein
MGLYDENGDRITKSGLATTDPTPVPMKTITNDVVESFRYPGESSGEGTGRRLKWRAGQTVPQSEIDAAFPAATITSVTGTAHAAGGDTITIHGTNLDGVTAATVGGTACTNVQVVDPQTVTAVAPPKAAGPYTVAVTDDSGTASLPNGLTVVA